MFIHLPDVNAVKRISVCGRLINLWQSRMTILHYLACIYAKIFSL